MNTDNDTAKTKSNLKILAFFKLQSVAIKRRIFISDVNEVALAPLLLLLLVSQFTGYLCHVTRSRAVTWEV